MAESQKAKVVSIKVCRMVVLFLFNNGFVGRIRNMLMAKAVIEQMEAAELISPEQGQQAVDAVHDSEMASLPAGADALGFLYYAGAIGEDVLSKTTCFEDLVGVVDDNPIAALGTMANPNPVPGQLPDHTNDLMVEIKVLPVIGQISGQAATWAGPPEQQFDTRPVPPLQSDLVDGEEEIPAISTVKPAAPIPVPGHGSLDRLSVPLDDPKKPK